MTFGNIPKKFSQSFVKFDEQNIVLSSDIYFIPPFKDHEHVLRGNSENLDYKISGSEQKHTTEFSKELRNSKLKVTSIKFVIEHWASYELTPYFGGKNVKLSYDNCYDYKVRL